MRTAPFTDTVSGIAYPVSAHALTETHTVNLFLFPPEDTYKPSAAVQAIPYSLLADAISASRPVPVLSAHTLPDAVVVGTLVDTRRPNPTSSNYFSGTIELTHAWTGAESALIPSHYQLSPFFYSQVDAASGVPTKSTLSHVVLVRNDAPGDPCPDVTAKVMSRQDARDAGL